MRKIVFDFHRNLAQYSMGQVYSIESIEPLQKNRNLRSASFRAFDTELGLVIIQWKYWQVENYPSQQFVTVECVEDDDWVCIAEFCLKMSTLTSQVSHHTFSVAIYGCPEGDWVMV